MVRSIRHWSTVLLLGTSAIGCGATQRVHSNATTMTLVNLSDEPICRFEMGRSDGLVAMRNVLQTRLDPREDRDLPFEVGHGWNVRLVDCHGRVLTARADLALLPRVYMVEANRFSPWPDDIPLPPRLPPMRQAEYILRVGMLAEPDDAQTYFLWNSGRRWAEVDVDGAATVVVRDRDVVYRRVASGEHIGQNVRVLEPQTDAYARVQLPQSGAHRFDVWCYESVDATSLREVSHRTFEHHPRTIRDVGCD